MDKFRDVRVVIDRVRCSGTLSKQEKQRGSCQNTDYRVNHQSVWIKRLQGELDALVSIYQLLMLSAFFVLRSLKMSWT